jgi:hypothetical protein
MHWSPLVGFGPPGTSRAFVRGGSVPESVS